METTINKLHNKRYSIFENFLVSKNTVLRTLISYKLSTYLGC